MSLRAEDEYPIPEATRRVAHAAFPKGTLCMRLADRLGPLYRDEQFTALFPGRGQPALSPARLALVTVLQFVEGLSDRQAADAVRGRIDWKYALGLELTDPGFDHTVLSEFRGRLVAGEAGLLLLDTLLARARELGLLKRRCRQRTDSTHVLAAVRTLNRLERVGETLRAALNELATLAPDWLRALAPAAWYERYGERVETDDLPESEAERQKLAAAIGADGRRLLRAIEAADRPELGELPAVRVLRRIWDEQDGETAGRVALRAIEAMPSPAGLIASPYDPQARSSTKRGMAWVGYKVHTIRTQSTIRLRGPLAPRRGAVQRDDMPDLQAALVNDDALDHELQHRLLVGERGLVQPAAHPFAERGQVGQHLLRPGALAA
jgi:transposase